DGAGRHGASPADGDARHDDRLGWHGTRRVARPVRVPVPCERLIEPTKNQGSTTSLVRIVTVTKEEEGRRAGKRAEQTADRLDEARARLAAGQGDAERHSAALRHCRLFARRFDALA